VAASHRIVLCRYHLWRRGIDDFGLLSAVDRRRGLGPKWKVSFEMAQAKAEVAGDNRPVLARLGYWRELEIAAGSRTSSMRQVSLSGNCKNYGVEVNAFTSTPTDWNGRVPRLNLANAVRLLCDAPPRAFFGVRTAHLSSLIQINVGLLQFKHFVQGAVADGRNGNHGK
jgi:hypothetical protein